MTNTPTPQRQPDPWSTGPGFGQPSAPAYGQPPYASNPLPYAPAEDVSEPVGYAPSQFAPPPGYQPVVVQPYYGFQQVPEHPNATTVLVLGIIGLVMLGMGFPVTAPIAWFLGSKARREMRENPGRYRPSGSLTAGWVMGIIASVLMALMVLLIVLAIVLLVGLARG